MKTFILTVNHDCGRVRLQVTASDENAARAMIMACEGCPERSIIGAEVIAEHFEERKTVLKTREVAR